MRFLVILLLSTIYFVESAENFHKVSEPVDLSPHNYNCNSLPNGIRIPIDGHCNYFLYCDNGEGVLFGCGPSVPNFDHCSQQCVNDLAVCIRGSCSGTTTTGYPTTTPPPTPAPTIWTTTTPWYTTTRFNPPTAPTGCTPRCDASNFWGQCSCIEQWKCINKVCQCDWSVECPFTADLCVDMCGCNERCYCQEPEKCYCNWNTECPMDRPTCVANCGCDERCTCYDENNCYCNPDLQCPFNQTDCNQRCGCANNCDCASSESCVCRDSCACFQPPPVCPFWPYDCTYRCGCEQRCICNGMSCQCDPNMGC